jgi:hypothetical protein
VVTQLYLVETTVPHTVDVETWDYNSLVLNIPPLLLLYRRAPFLAASVAERRQMGPGYA